jgi:hypothetical protein
MNARRVHTLNRRRFPTLARFASGYLHQDMAVEHGSPRAARDAFLADASAAERRAFADEAALFVTVTADWPAADARAAFAGLGGAWAPRSRAALFDLLTPSVPSRGRSSHR